MTKKCEHSDSGFFSRTAAQSIAEQLSDKTGIVHVVKKHGSMWIATCFLFDDYKD